MTTGPAARAGCCAAVAVPANTRPRATRMARTRRICNVATVLPPATLESDQGHARRCAERAPYGSLRLPPQRGSRGQRGRRLRSGWRCTRRLLILHEQGTTMHAGSFETASLLSVRKPACAGNAKTGARQHGRGRFHLLLPAVGVTTQRQASAGGE